MKTAQPPAAIAQGPARLLHAGNAFARAAAGKPAATSVVLSTKATKANSQKQHAAIAKLLKMCQTSPVVKRADQGITAEVRRDRDRGHV